MLYIRLTYIVYLHVSLWDQHVDSSLLYDRENSLESDSLFDIHVHVVNFHYFRHLQLLMTYFISAGVFGSIFNTVKTVVVSLRSADGYYVNHPASLLYISKSKTWTRQPNNEIMGRFLNPL